MKKVSVKLVALFFVLLIAVSSVFASATAVAKDNTAEKTSASQLKKTAKPEITISSEHLSVTKGKTIQLTATVTGVEETPEITWHSSDEKIATVDQNGKVKGKEAGKTIITASATVNNKNISSTFALNVVTSSNFIKNLLEKQQVLSYQYSYEDNYYYTNDKEAWQYNFGYGPIYDIVAPYVLLEYDYVRVFFEYEEKDWMIQLWKGQYGLLFYGAEIGIYNKEHTGKEDNLFTFYSCPPVEDWAKMELTLYHQNLDGSWTREFSRPYGDYWWCTGFKDGHLRIVEPADELRMVGRVTLKSKEMTKLFATGLADCNFIQVDSKDKIENDTFYVDGKDVYLQWQDINEAENTMAIKIGTGLLWSSGIFSFLLTILLLLALLPMLGLGIGIFII